MRSKKKSPRSPRVTAIGVLGLVLAGLGAAILMASHESSSPIPRLPTVDAPPAQAAARPTPDAPPSQAVAEPTPKKAPAARTQAKVTVAVSPVSVMPVSAMPVTRPVETAAAPRAAVVESASRTATPEPAPVTITGCLERDDTSFRLKDTN